MSYDLFEQAFRDREADHRPEQRAAVLNVLKGFGTPEPDGFCRIRTADGGEADFFVGQDAASHFMVNHFSAGEAMDLIVRAARAAGLVIFGGGIPPALTERSQLRHLPEELVSDQAPVFI